LKSLQNSQLEYKTKTNKLFLRAYFEKYIMDFYLKKFVDLKELTILETVKKKKKKARA
jgi:hypothetical protein